MLGKHNTPWFVVADVAEVPGYRDASNAVSALDDDEVNAAATSIGSHGVAVVLLGTEPGQLPTLSGSASQGG
ncbi:hypothetical protein [Frankia tisae]|uniref:hypothetical protein n=1 Tax=Frankia tisae TaxID=2950104 RepID=UPI0021BF57DA|nr:hypothetical protein [Frankia tisae]